MRESRCGSGGETRRDVKTPAAITGPRRDPQQKPKEYKIESRSRSAASTTPGGCGRFRTRTIRDAQWGVRMLCHKTGRILTRKPPFFLLPPCGRRERGSRVRLCDGESHIATVSKRIVALQPAQQRGRRGVHGFRLSPAPSQRVHRVPERGGRHGECSDWLEWAMGRESVAESAGKLLGQPQQAMHRYAGLGREVEWR